MNKRRTIGVLCLCGLLAAGYGGYLGIAGGPDGKAPAGPKEIQKVLEDLAGAFNKHDAKAMAGLWTETGEYASVSSGDRLKGRKAIEADFAGFFAKHKKAQLSMEIESTRAITADVAMVEGTARVVKPGEAPTASTFQTILVKKNGRWLIDQVRETELPSPPSSAEHLKDLEWLIGTWTRKKDDAEVKVIGKWVANSNFLARHYSVAVKGVVEHEGTQIVGWDPIQQQIRSWTFDSDGGFGDALWQKEGKRWTIRANGVMPDGKKSTATQVLTYKDENHYGWQIVSRAVDGQFLPNIDEVILERQTTPAKPKE